MNLKSFIRRRVSSLRSKFAIRVKEVTVPYEVVLRENNRFKGQVAIVTGGSGVIGRSIAYRIASEGSKVYVCGTNQQRVNEVVDEINANGYVAKPLIFNLNDENSVNEAFEIVVHENGKIDTLVCCAGGGARDDTQPFVEQSMDVIDQIINVNLRGVILCAQKACKYMVKQENAKIIVISSTVGVRGMPKYSEYACAKAGIIAFVQSIAMELGKYGIRINCVTPGIVQRESIDEIQMERIKKTNWLDSYGKPEDIAGMVAYLNSEEADFITGQNYIIDGGRSLGLKGLK